MKKNLGGEGMEKRVWSLRKGGWGGGGKSLFT